MKVLLASTGSGSRGGGEIYFLRLARGLRARGVAVTLAVPDHPRMDELAIAAGAEVVRLPYRNLYDRRLRTLTAVLDRPQARRIVDQFCASGAAVVHLNQQVLEDGLELVAELDRRQIPYVCTTHVTRSPGRLQARAAWLREACVHHVLRKARSHHVTVAKSARESLLSWCPYLAARSSVIYNGVVDTTASVDRDARARLRVEWGVAEGTVLFGAVGRLMPQKDPQFLVKVAERVCREHAQVRFVWIGDGELRHAVETAIVRAGLQERFRVLGWRSDVGHCLAALDGFLMPSRFEGLPLALMEAMGAGMACVANAVDGIPEILAQDQSGILCEVGELDQWCKTLGKLIDAPDLRRRLGDAGQSRARDAFTLDRMAEQTLALYKSRLDTA